MQSWFLKIYNRFIDFLVMYMGSGDDAVFSVCESAFIIIFRRMSVWFITESVEHQITTSLPEVFHIYDCDLNMSNLCAVRHL